MLRKKHKMAILIEIPLNVETEQEATEQMSIIHILIVQPTKQKNKLLLLIA